MALDLHAIFLAEERPKTLTGSLTASRATSAHHALIHNSPLPILVRLFRKTALRILLKKEFDGVNRASVP
jgi:hypothetical protein